MAEFTKSNNHGRTNTCTNTSTLPRDALRRCLRDLMSLDKDPIKDVYLHFDEQDISTIHCLIIGPSGTPYHGGFYMFRMKIPINYPHSPPHVTFMTTDGKIRFHPNLYACGKVCLSILGTWSGPSWSSVMSLRSVIISLHSLLGHENPIQCEPGFERENPTSVRNRKYNEVIRYQNMRYAVCHMAQKPAILSFKETIAQICLDNATEYQELLISSKQKFENFKRKSTERVISALYGMTCIIAYDEIKLPK